MYTTLNICKGFDTIVKYNTYEYLKKILHSHYLYVIISFNTGMNIKQYF